MKRKRPRVAATTGGTRQEEQVPAVSQPTSNIPFGPSGPYRQEAEAVYQSGLGSPLPLPYGRKFNPPTGWSGHEGHTASWPDVMTWMEDRGSDNICVRLAKNALGVDVDAHGTKQGAVTLAALEAKHGPLPKTVVSTSRNDGISGIRLYRVPEGLSWPGTAGLNIDIIHHGYRYVMWKGSKHPEGGIYFTIDQRTGELDVTPSIEDLPELPLSWINYLSQTPLPRSSDNGHYDGPLYGEMSQQERSVVDAYVADQVERRLQLLRDAQCWPIGFADDVGDGRGWDKLTADVAQTLRTLHDEEWSGLDYHQLREQFLDAAPTDRTWTRRDADRKWLSQDKPAEGGGRIKPPALGIGFTTEPLPVDFWGQRESLQVIHDWARARMLAPWAVLGAALARITATVPPHVVIPAHVGQVCSLGLFVAMTAESSGGKSAAMAVAREAVEVGDLYTHQVGSGEGLVKMFAHKEKDENKQLVQVQTRTNMLFEVPEVDTMVGLAGRSGSTLMEVLRSGYMGERLGFGYGDPLKEINLEPHSYRFSLIVGVQPSRAGGLLQGKEAEGGTPQRFLWVPAADPTIPDEEPPEPPPWTLAHPDLQKWPSAWQGFLRISLPEVAIQETKRLRRENSRGNIGRLDGHANLTRIKVMIALALLDGRRTPTEEDWRISGQVMAKSDETRKAAELILQEASIKVAEARGHSAGIQAAVAEEAAYERRVRRVKQSLERHLADGEWIARGKLRKSLAGRDRPLFEDALTAMRLGLEIEVDERNGADYIRLL